MKMVKNINNENILNKVKYVYIKYITCHLYIVGVQEYVDAISVKR